MSPVESCRGCGGLFAFLPRGYCAECIDLRERRYQDVREWLLDNRGASVLDAAQATGVEESLIMAFVREGRLEFVGSAAATPEDEELKERIRRDLAARGTTGPAPAGEAARPAAPRPLGMRTRTS